MPLHLFGLNSAIKSRFVFLAAAQVRILYSLKQLMKNREGFSRHESVTLEQVFHLLRRQVSTVSTNYPLVCFSTAFFSLQEVVTDRFSFSPQTECDLFGYHSLEGDIVVLVMAVTEKPTKLQV